jgi:chaperonin GroEL
LVADILTQIGTEGFVSLETNKAGKTAVIFSKGVKLPFNLMSPYFCDNIDKLETEYIDAKILIADGIIKSITEIISVLEDCIKNNTPLVLIADDFVPEVITALLLNRAKSNLRVVAIKCGIWATDKSTVLNDIAALTDATIISPKNDLTLADAKPAHLGSVERISINMTETTFIANNNTAEFNKHIKRIKAQITAERDDYAKTRLRERLARLTASVAIISVGCPTDAETMEKKLRIEDAVAAATNAMRDGIVAGGGLTYKSIANQIKPTTIGGRILKKSLSSIHTQICKNAGCRHIDISPSVIDPTTVIKSVIRNAISAAAVLLTTDGIILNVT